MKSIRTLSAVPPLYRVIARSWKDPLDSSYSQRAPDRRWNTPEFPALYCCSTKRVARAVTMDIFRFAGIVLEDLRPAHRPQLAEIDWSGDAVDVATAEGVKAAGFPPSYPAGVSKAETRAAAESWHAKGREGVICRSASLWRLEFSNWTGVHSLWSETAIYPQNARTAPRLLRRLSSLRWFLAPLAER